MEYFLTLKGSSIWHYLFKLYDNVLIVKTVSLK